ncbi:MAG: hypothetical protein R2932_42525 [Caldilineaceae bacterium]
MQRSIVGAILDLVAVVVTVAGIADAIFILIFLIWIGKIGADILAIVDAVAIDIIVTAITKLVAIAICCSSL